MSRGLLQHWRHLQDCQDSAHCADAAEAQRLAATNKVRTRVKRAPAPPAHARAARGSAGPLWQDTRVRAWSTEASWAPSVPCMLPLPVHAAAMCNGV